MSQKSKLLLIYAISVLFVFALQAYSQTETNISAVAGPVPPDAEGTFFDVIRCSGYLGVLIWAGIFLWGFASLPLGIISIVKCCRLSSSRWPLTLKMLILGSFWLFVLGWIGAAQGTIGAFTVVACGTPDVGVLALLTAQALYSLEFSLAFLLVSLLFISISVVIIHLKQINIRDS